MPPVTVTINRVDLRNVSRMLRGMDRAASDLRVVFLTKILPSMRAEHRKQIASRGSHFGTPWAPNTPVTLQLRRRAGFFGRLPMRASGRLGAAYTTAGGDARVTIKAHSLSFDVGVPYARPPQDGFLQTHIFGRRRKAPRQVPPRPIAPKRYPAALVDKWELAIATHVLRGGGAR